jgi:hypothetical protein
MRLKILHLQHFSVLSLKIEGRVINIKQFTQNLFVFYQNLIFVVRLCCKEDYMFFFNYKLLLLFFPDLMLSRSEILIQSLPIVMKS